MTALSPDALEAALRDIGARRYHDRHPFHRLLHGGRCSRGQVQAWALNRYCYQAVIPLKDAALIARCDDPAVRRAWRSRLADHDGGSKNQEGEGGDGRGGEGGLARWLTLTDGLGLAREVVVSQAQALPASRFAALAYLDFVRSRSLLEAIASSLTELFSPAVIGERIDGMLKHYDFVTPETLAYFQARPPQASRDSAFALRYVKAHATTAVLQRQVQDALVFKCEVLWSMLDALYAAYVTPGHIPPGAFVPEARDTVAPVVPEAT